MDIQQGTKTGDKDHKSPAAKSFSFLLSKLNLSVFRDKKTEKEEEINFYSEISGSVLSSGLSSYFAVLKNDLRIKVSNAESQASKGIFERINYTRILSNIQRYNQALACQQVLMEIEHCEALNEEKSFTKEIKINEEWANFSEKLLFTQNFENEKEITQSLEDIGYIERSIRKMQNHESAEVRNKLKVLKFSIDSQAEKDCEKAVFAGNINSESFQDSRYNSALQRFRGYAGNFLNVCRLASKNIRIEHPENQAVLEKWNMCMMNSTVIIKTLLEAVLKENINFLKLSEEIDRINECIFMLDEFIGPQYEFLGHLTTQLLWLSSSLERELCTMVVRCQNRHLSTVLCPKSSVCAGEEELNIMELLLILQERFVLISERLKQMNFQRVQIIEELVSSHKLFDHFVGDTLTSSVFKDDSQQDSVESKAAEYISANVFESILPLRQSQVHSMTFILTCLKRIEKQRRKLFHRLRVIHCIRGFVFGRDDISEPMLSYLLSVESEAAQKTLIDSTKSTNELFAIHKQAGDVFLKESYNISGNIFGLSFRSAALLNVILNWIKIYDELPSRTTLKDLNRHKFEKKKRETNRIKDGIKEAIYFAIHQAKEDFKFSGNTGFLADIHYASENFPLCIKEIIQRLSYQMDFIITCLIAESNYKCESEDKNAEILILKDSLRTYINQLGRNEQLCQVSSLLQQTEKGLGQLQDRYEELRRQKRKINSVKTSLRSQNSQSSGFTELEKVKIPAIDFETKMTCNAMRKVESLLPSLRRTKQILFFGYDTEVIHCELKKPQGKPENDLIYIEALFMESDAQGDDFVEFGTSIHRVAKEITRRDISKIERAREANMKHRENSRASNRKCEFCSKSNHRPQWI